MSKKPMFIPNPDGSEGYLVNLAGVLLMTGDVIFGDPAETTPTGRANAMRMVERILQEAEKRGFKHTSTVWNLMRRNEPNRRLANLAQEAMDLIPKDVQGQIMQEELSNARDGACATPPLLAKKHPGKHEPESNPRFLRPGPDGVDPRFMAAGQELKRIAEEEGEDAIHKPEHAHLYAKMMRFAPKDLREEMEAKAHELGLIPKATHVGEDGQALYSVEQLANANGVSLAEMEQFIVDADIDPDDLHCGPVYPLQ